MLNPSQTTVSFLMAAPFADATQDLVKQFNQEHRGVINLKVIRGPLETEAMSDLAISSLLLGKAPFDVLLMDVTWLPKYAAAGWMVPLEDYFNDNDINELATGAREGNSTIKGLRSANATPTRFRSNWCRAHAP